MRSLLLTLSVAAAVAVSSSDAAPSAQVAAASTLPASLQLRWELLEDRFDGPAGEGSSRAAFTLTNRGTKPLPARGWAIYWSALHQPRAGTVGGGVTIEEVVGDLQRMVPGDGFPGLAPGKSARFEYLTALVQNRSFAPAGPYVVFDEAPAKGYALKDYVAVPFERPARPGRDPQVVTPQAQFEKDALVRDLPLEALPPVFPTPLVLQKGVGALRLSASPKVVAPPELEAKVALALEILRTPAAATPRANSGTGDAATLVKLETGPVEGQTSPEAYELVVDPQQGIRIRGSSATGVFYGLQSLRSLLPALPAVRIVDAPRFGYRGLMLDVARNFQPKSAVLRTLDLMARYKLNALHLHLTEDEGWRLEIEGLPELTTVGARRGHTPDESAFIAPAYGSGPEVDRPFGSGFYSKADYVEILRYAAARHIEVIPELEMPGHARAAIKAMEARFRRLRAAGDAQGAARYLLSDPEDRSVYTSAQRYHDNVVNPALPSTYTFFGRVVEAVVALHREAGVPLRNLHLGGDEVPAGVWEKSPAVRAYLAERHLASVDDLWYVFYGRLEQILKAHGLVPSGWEEMALRKTRRDGRDVLIPNPTFAERGWRTYVWNNVPGWGTEDLAYRLANGGFKVVLCPVTNVYLDLAWNPNPEEPGLDWGGYVDLAKPFAFIPFDYYRNTREDRRGRPLAPDFFAGKDRLTDYGRANILGIQANLWSETLGGEGRLDSMLLPKVFGLVERAWAAEPAWARESDEPKAAALYREAWSEFVNVLGKQVLPRLDAETPAWSYRIPTPGLKLVDGQVRTSLSIPGFTLRYTTDGREPTATSPEARGAIAVSGQGGGLRVAAFDRRGRRGHSAKLAAN